MTFRLTNPPGPTRSTARNARTHLYRMADATWCGRDPQAVTLAAGAPTCRRCLPRYRGETAPNQPQLAFVPDPDPLPW